MSDHITREKDGAVMRLKFNRPEKKNAITAAMYAALADGLVAAGSDDEVRAVLIESEGDIFTAGNDIGDFMAGAAALGQDEDAPVIRFLKALATAEKPLLAAVQGPAVGVGVTMLLHCDIVFASEKATFKTPFVDLALVPEAASSLILPRFAGHVRAAELLLLGRTIDAQRAERFGIVNCVARPEALAEAAIETARELAAKAPESMRLTKRLMRGDPDEIILRMENEASIFAKRLQSPEFQEAGAAFLQKRKPDFSKLG